MKRSALLALVLIIGFAGGRFVLFEPESGSATPTRPSTTGTSSEIATLKRTLKQNPNDVGSLQSLAAAYLQRSLDTLDTSYYPLAEDALDRADQISPDLDRTLIARGVLELGRHHFSAARDLASRVLIRKPADADALAVAFDAAIELGHYDEAAQYIERLLDLRPGLPAYSRFSYLQELQGDVPGAIVAMREANVAAGRIGSAGITTFLGDLQFNRGNLAEAEAEYRTALRISAGFPNAELGLGRVLAARGDTEAAIATLERVDRRSPSPTVAEVLGDLEAGQGHHRDAERWYERVRELTQVQIDSGENTDLELALFEVEHARTPAESAHALALAQRAYAARPDNIYVNDALAVALLKSGDVSGASHHIAHALRLGTQNARFHYHAALIAELNGDLATARETLQTALDLNPWFTFHDRQVIEDLAERLSVCQSPTGCHA
jgi:tetratricopeptide (TPR) repeat protein